MTINLSDNSPRVIYTVAAGLTQSSFTVPFDFFEEGNVNVYVDGVLKTITTDYTVSGGSGTGGTVAMLVTGISGGSSVVLTRDVALERTTDFPTSGPFDVSSLNNELDKIIAVQADLKSKVDRSIQASDFDEDASIILPSRDNRKGKMLAFNASTGDVEVAATVSGVTALSAVTNDIETLADIEDGTVATDAISNLATITSQVSAVASNLSSVSSVGSNILHVANVSNNMSAVNAAVTNAASANAALATFQSAFVSGATAPANPTDGDLWYDTANTQLRVYVASTSQWEVAGSFLNALTSTHLFTATAGQTTFTTDDNGNALSIYTNGNTFVYKNGVRLTIGTSSTNDYYISGNVIYLNAGANLNDVLLVEVFTKFTSVQEASLDQKVTDASTSATNAAASASAAATSLSNIGSSETNAASSATAAAASASSASSDAASTAADVVSTAADVVSSSASQSAAATSESNAASSASAASASQSAASTSQANASTSETNAAASAAAALVSENAAATSESNAATSETNAAASATASAASATNSSASSTSAASAQAAAESARDSALAAFDSFDDRYLGVFASNPTTDNDGDALVAGSLYFNSSSSAMQVYTGSGWTAAYVSGTGFASLSGASFTGDITVPNITLTGTIDGRDPSADGTKLDGIEAGATGDQTASEIMTAIQTVDGASSGLDADLLDAQQGSYYLDYNNFTNRPAIPTNNNQLTNGAGYITSVPAQSFASLTGKPTTISGYGITDAFNGAYGSLTGLPTIPTNNNQLSNGAGYVTSSGVTSVATGAGLVGTITSSGTIEVSSSCMPNTNQHFGNNSGEYSYYDNSNAMIRMYVNSAEQFRIEGNGNVHADGDIVAFTTSFSDSRLKTDIAKIDNALDKVEQLNGYTFTYTTDDRKSAGVIAQEVEKVLPSAVSEKEMPLKIDDGVAYKTVEYDQLVGLLIEAVNELSNRVKELEADNGNN
jgi:hypothetical protein